ncbi:unnamed protein product [Ectocarpus sp. 6 AP-2014]
MKQYIFGKFLTRQLQRHRFGRGDSYCVVEKSRFENRSRGCVILCHLRYIVRTRMTCFLEPREGETSSTKTRQRELRIVGVILLTGVSYDAPSELHGLLRSLRDARW